MDLYLLPLLAVMPALVFAIAGLLFPSSAWRSRLVAAGLGVAISAAAGAMAYAHPVQVILMKWGPPPAAMQPLSLSVILRADRMALTVLAVLGLTMSGIALRFDKEHRGATGCCCFLLILSLWFCLSENVLIALILQGAMTAVVGLMLAWDSPGMTSRAMRSTWVWLTLGDVLCLSIVLQIWQVDRSTTFQDLADPATVIRAGRLSLAVVGSIGSLLWLALLPRLLQFPSGILLESCSEKSGVVLASAVCLALGVVGWKWLLPAQIWWATADTTSSMISSTAAMTGLLAAWFALCSDNARSRLCWLTSWGWSAIPVVLLSTDQVTAESWLATWLFLAVTINSSWLLSLWPAGPESNLITGLPRLWPDFSRIFFTRRGHGTNSEPFVWEDSIMWGPSGAALNSSSVDSEPVSRPVAGTRWAVLLGGCGLVTGPACAGHRVELSLLDVAWPDVVRWVSIAMAMAAVVLLFIKMSADRFPNEQRWVWLTVIGATGPLGIALFPGTEFLQAACTRWTAAVGIAAAVAGGLAAVILARGTTLAGTARPLWSRLGARRLYLPQLLQVGVFAPIWLTAQFVWLCDAVFWQRLIGPAFKQLPAWGADADVDLPHSDPGFFAMSLILTVSCVLVTLVWMSASRG